MHLLCTLKPMNTDELQMVSEIDIYCSDGMKINSASDAVF